MRIDRILEAKRPVFSVEFFPPKTEEATRQLFETARSLRELEPDFVSVTYGAGGSTREGTVEITRALKDEHGFETMAHLSCVGETREGIAATLDRIEAAGIENVFALRGDPPRGETRFVPVAGAPGHANELVQLVRREFPRFAIAVAGYPETHHEAPTPEADLANLKRKVEAGADVVLTQLFYANKDFFAFRRRYQEAGIHVPLVPGILPIIDYRQIQRITALCGAKLPPALVAELEARRDDPEAELEIGVAHAIRQCRELLDAGVPGLHFYVLNKATAPARILQALSLPPR
jgi:methylenetetrahydrofolate reductase (NADPH)